MGLKAGATGGPEGGGAKEVGAPAWVRGGGGPNRVDASLGAGLAAKAA